MTSIRPVRHIWRLTALTVAASLALAACGNQNEKREKEIAAKMKTIEPTVTVITVQPEEVALENDLPGRLESVRTADIVPQATGIVKERLFEEGSFVKKGQPLYRLDDASYNAALQSAHAALMTAEVALEKARADVARYRPLVQADAISKQEWDAAQAAERAAVAQVRSAQAAIHSAEVNMRHTQITAPISGHIAQSLVSEGSLVTANTTKMASIRQNDPLYVNITQSASDMLKLRQQISTGQKVLNEHIPVSIELEDGTSYPHQGRLLFADSNVDKTTGQLTVRAEIPNPQMLLMSGLYVRVKLPLTSVPEAFLVPQQAVTRGQTDTVTIVNAAGKMEPRTVKTAGQKGNYWVISEGLNPGDKVVVDGTMIAGMLNAAKVKTQEWQPENGMSAAPAASAAASAPDTADNSGGDDASAAE
ncbi:MAG: efflux RND transporter periplasmic adaptor subunit [Conchiformibius sp.]|nr:efflux RND transporter periplasmic adaptor subunit [Conchiformibius sp.]